MLVDIDEKLVDKNTRQQMSGTINTECEIDCVRVAKPKNKVFTDVLSKYECITRVDYQNESDLHHVRHHITTTDSPICAKSRGLPPLKLKIAKKEFEHMMHLSIIQQSSSPCALPLHMVPKEHQDWPPCGDDRRLNNETAPNRYPICHLHDFLLNLHGEADLFETIPCESIPPEDIEKTVVSTFWFVVFLRMSLVIKNAAQIFQRFIDEVIRSLEFVFIYIEGVSGTSHRLTRS